MTEKTCFICKGPNDTTEPLCATCAKTWVKNPVGIDLVTGKPFTVRNADSWWLRADDLIVAALILIAEWREANAVYYGGMPHMSTENVLLTPEQKQAHLRLQVIAVAEMLIGMAFECAIKAIIIGADESIVDDKLRWKKLTKNHKLVSYFDETPLGNMLTIPERSLLDRLQEAIEWRGRYPSGRKNLNMHMKLSSEKEFEHWHDLWRKLCEYAGHDVIMLPDDDPDLK
jgi:hypothetical protein